MSDYVYKFWHLLDETLNAILFILIGLEIITVFESFQIPFLFVSLIVIVLVVGSRWIGVSIPIAFLSLFKNFEKKTALIITWGGLRGGLSVALALNLPDDIGEGKALILFLTYVIVLFTILSLLPESINFSNAIKIASVNSKMEVLNFSFDLENRYTVWSGILGGTFLMMSYFGTDQSQVQRYLSGKSLKEMQLGMIFNGVFKIPMQFFILFIGVMVFVFYQFNPSPINFNPQGEEVILNTVYQNEYIELKESLEDNFKEKTLVFNEFLISGNQELKDKINYLGEQEQYLRDRAKILIGKDSRCKETEN